MAEMEFAVPTDLPILDVDPAALQQQPPTTPAAADKQESVHFPRSNSERPDFEAHAKAYFEDKNVVPILNALLTELFTAQPDDPVDHMLKFLMRHPSLADMLEANESQELLEQSEVAIAYSHRFKLPQLFDELLTALLDDAPDDAARFALTWLRWNKNGFISRHMPEGYRAYVAAKERRDSKAAAAVTEG